MKTYLLLLGIFVVGWAMIYADDNSFQITSPAFTNQGLMPVNTSCKGDNKSPKLEWKNSPKGTQSFALTCIDPDAPGGNFIHWIIYNIPSQNHALNAGIDKTDTLQDGSKQGLNSFRRVGYDGPCPPPGKPHRYIFTLYALDSKLDLPARKNLADLENAIHGHILKQTQLIGLFGAGGNY